MMLTDVDISNIKNENISAMFIKSDMIIDRGENVMVSVSGGSDSDILVDSICRCKPLDNIHFVFFDTGIEYRATKRHLDDLEDRYGITIERERAMKSIPQCVKEYGQPFLSKWVSEMIYRLQLRNFDFSDRPLSELVSEFGMCYPIRWWCNDFSNVKSGKNSQYNIQYNRGLKEFLIENPPQYRVSNKCCEYSKKKTSAQYVKKNDITLMITGIRSAEGGSRAIAYHSCFSEATDKKIAQFRPLLYFTNDDKNEYNRICHIRNSDCYRCYGMTRTGCAGCPYARDLDLELKTMQQYEPGLYNAVCHIFADSYSHTAKYRSFKQFGDAHVRQTALDQFIGGN